MIRLRRFTSRLHAEHAAIFLRNHGVSAVVVGDYVNQLFGGPLSPRMLQVELMLLDANKRDEAEHLLEEFEAEPIELDPDWEEQALPELAGLDLSAYDLTCPSCGYDLAGLDPVGCCPECSAEYDAAGLIVARHGPEALASLFASAPEPTPIKRYTCPECRRDLSSFPARGRCPECGRLFDKESH